MTMCHAFMDNSLLRSAIQRNLVSFPSQVPAFLKHEEDNRRIVQLYFVCGWRLNAICARYGISRSAARGIISEWRIRAVGAGYIQEIDPEALDLLAAEHSPQHDFAPAAPARPEPVSALAPADLAWEMALPA